MDITFFETFGVPNTDGECTAVHEGVTQLSIANDTLLNAVSDQAVCQIEGDDYVLSGPKPDAVWSGLVNRGTRQQREVCFAQLVRKDGAASPCRIVILQGELHRGEAILDVRVSGQEHTMSPTGLVCFTQGCNILTAFGDMPVERLQVGDLVHTVDNGLQPIRWIGSREMSRTRLQVAPQSQPVLIKKDTFGPYLPAQDIWVSQQHQMLLETEDAQSLFRLDSVLAPAKALVNGDTIQLDEQSAGVNYMHILFDEHQVVFVDGIPSESFYPCPASLLSLTDEDRQQVFQIMPHLEYHPLSYGPMARPSVTIHKSLRLAA
ncbi:Hint domain-containing protein [Amylibacter sp. IMCC11727]|uniref:Hint domain-containing protein n=1 Tax=Amylibacter sp. IMCC11727 TaxID=3039851 RepID=UPI00244DC42C|nr:Hint domain-containing protein [Amylibacter sp. IMCC11727]WGI20808.1 Hint domain-containing protein [Amylibacter sp. IMCC11727]